MLHGYSDARNGWVSFQDSVFLFLIGNNTSVLPALLATKDGFCTVPHFSQAEVCDFVEPTYLLLLMKILAFIICVSKIF